MGRDIAREKCGTRASIAVAVFGDATIGWSLPTVLAAIALAACVLIAEHLAAFAEHATAQPQIAGDP